MFFDESGKPVLQAILDCLLQQDFEKQWETEALVTQEALLPEEVVLSICREASAVFREESNIISVDAPVNVVGDIHGQFIDLLYLFELCGPLTQSRTPPSQAGSVNLLRPQSISSTTRCDSQTCKDSASPRGNVQVLDDGTCSPPPSDSGTSSRCSVDVKVSPSSSASGKPVRPKILRKRSEDQVSYTFRRRNSIWETSDSVKRDLSIAEVEGTKASTTTTNTKPRSRSSEDGVTAEKMPTFLFMGDYVDRGNFGCECILYLLALKIVFPNNVFLLRGNHETRCMTKRQFSDGVNFEAECVAKYGQAVYENFMTCFDCIPLSALVESGSRRFLAMHGGLSSKVKSLDDIRAIDRFCEPPLKGAMCDLLWSDPVNEQVAERFSDSDYQEFLEFDFLPNPVRGCSSYYCFGAVTEFLNKNKLAGIFRAHECKEEGISFHFAKTRSESFAFPLVTTVFSAPNYCGTYDNKGGVIRITEDDIDILRFGSASANPLQLAYTPHHKPPSSERVSVSRFDNNLGISAENSAKFQKACADDQGSESHPGWQSLRKVTRIVNLLGKYRRATSLSGTALYDMTQSAGIAKKGDDASRSRRFTAASQVPFIIPESTQSIATLDTATMASLSATRARRRVGVVNEDGTTTDAETGQSPLSHREAGLALFGRTFITLTEPALGEENEAPGTSTLSPSTSDLLQNSSVQGSVSAEDNQQLRILFDAIDHDGNGTISQAELEKFGEGLGCDPHVVAHVRELMDQDHDGNISFDEFVEYAGEMLYTFEPPPA